MTEPEEVTVSPCSSSSPEDYSIQQMFDKIMKNTNAFFRHQQLKEPNLGDAEKLVILENLYHQKPALFLSRYENYLDAQDAQFFVQSAASDPDIEFVYKRLLISDHSPANQFVQQRNRRYIQLKKMLGNDQHSDYFSDKEMRRRDPLMYDRMIGKFQTKQELTETMHPDSSAASQTLSSILLDMVDNQEIAERKRNQQFAEEMSGMKVNGDDAHSNDDDESEMEDENQQPDESSHFENSNFDNQPPSPSQKEICRKMFIEDMIEKFLDGEDAEYYDYNEEDARDQTEREILRIEEQDEQDRYFDGED